MGFLSTLFNVDWRDRYGSNLTALVLTGVLGGYTTFSSYQLDTANLYNKRRAGWHLLDWLGGCRSNRGRARRDNSQVVRITRTLIDAQGRNSRIDRRRYRRRFAWLLMLGVANLPGGFPMPIFVANMTAALLIGVLSALTITGGVIGSGGKLLLTTGIMGGLSTFSSFVWGTHQMLANPAEQARATDWC